MSYLTILGRKGQGKTSLALTLARSARRALVVDVLDEYPRALECVYPGDLDGLARVARFQARTVPENTDELRRILRGLPRDALVILDELSLYAGPVDCPEELERAYRFGRHSGFALVAVARRPAELPRIVTALTDFWAIFRTSEPRDLQYLRAAGLDVAGLPDLSCGQFFFYRPGGDRYIVTTERISELRLSSRVS